MKTYPLFSVVHEAETKIIFLQQIQGPTYLVKNSLPFYVSLWNFYKENSQTCNKKGRRC